MKQKMESKDDEMKKAMKPKDDFAKDFVTTPTDPSVNLQAKDDI